ncbi:MAG: hypothetical protein A2655_02005 [Candidatus Yanofskybacteria bacterium RIFCSPHIGHO2_01_FULL_43_42]|uniref:Cytidylyltransferase n=1 Tax=Candidatus Yanofskybacteria bacterium RIFCSPLOWO2_01_FULL_43_22 TaxID=1802695 RepID=A0A1F8GIW5_9BACT|nr:MAG: hypothetical protein A2655_02005 [Candidatus Yanofskybacteria bacterium RIFCSPHIGHO2_01_FULL_43_42]OGN13243.1 MAG: hypothetical protein A3D48_02910 [Candidatus Yanofskybacteria bacterium RIFCSPHIGHO2_02_FULL_43_17]OGN24658.1 MAG: hypothetical protein A3A13_01135 [Candidatus Yanofskybacteria bacterium RIFCSPLOWO2_01_FULL_43_22]
MSVYSIIQARGGSKGVPSKNIRPLGGFPLIAYSIAASKLSKTISRTIVSTDSEEIAEVSRKYGAEVPFLRPSKYAQDKSTDLDVFAHAISWLEKKEGVLPDLMVQLRTTTPLRDSDIMDSAVNLLMGNNKATALRSAHKLAEPPQKMIQFDKKGLLTGFFPNDPRVEYYNLPRQTFTQAYHPNGYVDIIRPAFVKNNPGVFYGPKVIGFETPFVTEIDKPEDFEYLEYQFKKNGSKLYNYLKKIKK